MVIYTETSDPKSYEEAPMSSTWKKAMECEIQAI